MSMCLLLPIYMSFLRMMLLLVLLYQKRIFDWNMSYMIQNLVFLRFVSDLAMICLIDRLCSHCIRLLSNMVHLVNKTFVKFWICFSAPECPFVCKEWEVRKAVSIILNVKQGTLISDDMYSNISVFPLIEVLRYLRRFLFPSRVVSALMGLVLYLCQYLNCPMIGSRFRCFCNSSSVIFSVNGRKVCHGKVCVVEKCVKSSGSWRFKTWLIVYFESIFGVPDKFTLAVRLSFSI